jgi:hypothetical protein
MPILLSHLHIHYLHPPSILLIPERFVTIILLRWQLTPPLYASPSSSSSVYPVDPGTFRNDYTARQPTLAADATFICITFILRLSC